MVDRPHKPTAISPTSPSSQPHVDISSDKTPRVIATLASGDNVTIYLHGATVTSWKSHGGKTENLWLSDAAVLDGTKPIRGGVPVVFPNFGPPPKNHATSALPQHGFARNSKWEYLGKSSTESTSSSSKSDDGIKLDFGLSHSQLPSSAREAWPHDFSLVYSVTLAPGTLQTSLNVRNEGKESWEFQMLLHTYFRVQDISKTSVAGLLGVQYVDKVLDVSTHTESNDQIKFTGEVDRVYSNIPQDTTSILEDGKPRLDVVRDNLKDTVVWNPWIAKSKGMGDFEPKDGYKKMVAVEVGAVDGFQKLEPGDSFEAGMLVKALL